LIKGTLLAILVIALSGYVFNITNIRSKYRIASVQGYHLLYRCLFTGILMFLFSSLLFSLLWPITSQYSFIYDIVVVSFPDITQGEFNLYSILAISLVLALTIAKIINIIIFRIFNFRYTYEGHEQELASRKEVVKTTAKSIPHTNSENTIDVNEEHAHHEQKSKKSQRQIRKAIKNYTDFLLDIIIYKSSTDNAFIAHAIERFLSARPILITLGNRRCYICYAYGIKTPKNHVEAQELAIIPLYSGYRHQDDLCFEITTPYHEVFDLLKEQSSGYSNEQVTKGIAVIDDFKITIPFNQVHSIANFDASKYRIYKSFENDRRRVIKSARELEEGEEIIINPD
jgi:hypothetical protein